MFRTIIFENLLLSCCKNISKVSIRSASLKNFAFALIMSLYSEIYQKVDLDFLYTLVRLKHFNHGLAASLPAKGKHFGLRTIMRKDRRANPTDCIC